MKKKLLSVVALLMTMLILLASCGSSTDVSTDTTDTADVSQSAIATDTAVAETETEPVVDNTPITVVDTYVPAEIFDQITTLFEGKRAPFTVYSADSAPYAIRDVYAVSNGKLKSVTIPVHTTGKADANGDLSLTMMVFDNSLSGLKKAP